MTLVVMLAIFMGIMWLGSLLSRKQQQRMDEERERLIKEAVVAGTWVRTTSGFYGKVVEADGDVVTLATPLGDETLWARQAIARAEEPPFASTTDLQQDEADDAQDVAAGGSRGAEDAVRAEDVESPGQAGEREAVGTGTPSSQSLPGGDPVEEHAEVDVDVAEKP